MGFEFVKVGSTVRRTVAALAVAAALVAGLAGAEAARAGNYLVVQCWPEYGAGAGEWTSFDTTEFNRYNEIADCSAADGTFLGMRVNHEGTNFSVRGAAAGWSVAAPNGTVIIQIAANAAGRGDASGHGSQLWAVPPSGSSPWRFGPNEGSGENPHIWTAGDGFPEATSFQVRLTCQQDQCPAGNTDFTEARRIGIALNDHTGPTVSSVAGGLVDGATVRGGQAVTITGSDVGSGLHSATVTVNGTEVARGDFGCSLASGPAGTVATLMHPCPANGSRVLNVDTAAAAFRQGLNQIDLCVADLATAGAPNSNCVSRDVRVDNACPPSAVAASSLSGRFGEKASRTVRHGRKVVVAGRAIGSGGEAVRGAEVCMGQRALADPLAAERLADTDATNKRGRFRLRLPAGPSSELRIAHWPPSGPPIERFLELNVRAKPTLGVRGGGGVAEGDQVRFHGRLHPPFAADRKVRVEAKAPAGWVGVPGCRERSSDRRGFGCSWRVPRQPGSGDYALRFRAFVPEQDGYPYERGASRVVRVAVNG